MRALVALLVMTAPPAMAQITPPAPKPVSPIAKPVPADLARLRAELKDVDAKIATLKGGPPRNKTSQGDAINRMAAADMAMLQELMAKKAALEQMISDTMKKASEGSSAPIVAPKDS